MDTAKVRQKKCPNIYQIECQNICQIECQLAGITWGKDHLFWLVFGLAQPHLMGFRFDHFGKQWSPSMNKHGNQRISNSSKFGNDHVFQLKSPHFRFLSPFLANLRTAINPPPFSNRQYICGPTGPLQLIIQSVCANCGWIIVKVNLSIYVLQSASHFTHKKCPDARMHI